MDLKQPVLRLLKPRHAVEMRRLHQLPERVVAPPMIPTPQHRRRPALAPRHRVRPMPAHVVERPYSRVLALDQEDREPRHGEGVVVAGFGEAGAVEDGEPGLVSGKLLEAKKVEREGEP
jgi:hypothetical protein